MKILFILIILSLLVAIAFLSLFIWAVKSGQFDDTETPSMRMLFENKRSASKNDKNQSSA
jgi:cbb3-type cytochrome oxidase maturation protein